MQSETVTVVLSILGAIGAWTITVAGLVLWLANRFRSVESLIHVEMAKLRKEVKKEITQVEHRVTHLERQTHRLQLKVFGFAPMSMDEIVERLEETPPEEG